MPTSLLVSVRDQDLLCEAAAGDQSYEIGGRKLQGLLHAIRAGDARIETCADCHGAAVGVVAGLPPSCPFCTPFSFVRTVKLAQPFSEPKEDQS